MIHYYFNIENIYNENTKKYFEEVVSSYNNGNYRATIVTLYSVVMTDIVYKLRDLSNDFEDKQAKNLLNNAQSNEKFKIGWESNMISTLNKSTSSNLLSVIGLSTLADLQKKRNLSAHPSLDDDWNLYMPNAPETAGLVLATLEHILSKPAYLMSRLDASNFTANVAKRKEYYQDDYHHLESYLERSYLKHMTPEDKVKLFKELWKFVFYLTDPNAKSNRDINYQCLVIIMAKAQEPILSKIEAESCYFINIDQILPAGTITLFCQFMNSFPGAYAAISKSSKTKEFIELLENEVAKNQSLTITSSFISKDIEAHLSRLEENYKNKPYDIASRSKAFRELEAIIREKDNSLEKILNFYLAIFEAAASGEKQLADGILTQYIIPHIANFSSAQLEQVIKHILENYRKLPSLEIRNLFKDIKQNLMIFEKNLDIISKYFDSMIEVFAQSHSFSVAEDYYFMFIDMHIEYFSAKQLESLLAAMNGNKQIYYTRALYDKFKCAYDQAKNKLPNHDFSQYKNIYEHFGIKLPGDA